MKIKLDFKHRLWTYFLIMGSILAVVVSSAFTTTSAWTATLPQTNPQGNPCLVYGINSALYLKCLANGTNQNFNNKNGSQNGGSYSNSQNNFTQNKGSNSNNQNNFTQNKGTNSNSNPVTFSQNNFKNNSNSPSKNQNTSSQQGQACLAFGVNSASYLKCLANGTNQNFNNKNGSQNGGSNSNNQNNSNQNKGSNSNTVTFNQSNVKNSSNSSSNNQNTSTQPWNNTGKTPFFNPKGSTQASNSNGNNPFFGNNQSRDNSIIQSFERMTGHHLTSAELQKLEGSSFLNSEDETHFLQRLENITGRDLNNTQITVVDEEVSQNEENGESASTDIAEGEIIPVTGGIVTTYATTPTYAAILAGTVGSLNQTSSVNAFFVGNTNVQVSTGVTAANQIQNGLNVELGGYYTNTGTFMASSVLALTNNPITVVAGTVSSLNETGALDTFLIGNTTIQMSASIVGNYNIQNGVNIKVDGFFTGGESFVATKIQSMTQ